MNTTSPIQYRPAPAPFLSNKWVSMLYPHRQFFVPTFLYPGSGDIRFRRNLLWDPSISVECRGLLLSVIAMQKAIEFEVLIEDTSNRNRCSKQYAAKLINQLLTVGYLRSVRVTRADGTAYVLVAAFDQPHPAAAAPAQELHHSNP